jgi:hypothetical protein
MYLAALAALSTMSPPMAADEATSGPLEVTLVDGISGKPLAGQKLAAWERLADGTLQFGLCSSSRSGGYRDFGGV